MKGGRSRSVRFHHLIERNIRGNYENAEAGKGTISRIGLKK